ncbi:hypothetical protein Peur_050599 [Populus x canadensis]
MVNAFPKGDVPEWVCNAMEVAGIKISSYCASFSSSHDSELEKDAPTKKLDDDEKFDDDDEVSFDNKHTPSKKSDEHKFTTNNAGFGKFIF